MEKIIDDDHYIDLLSKQDKDFQEKAVKFWKEGKKFDIFEKTTENGDQILLAVERTTIDQMKEEAKENFIKQKSKIVYYGQYPHLDWKRAVGEYEIFSKVFEYDEDDSFTKTEYYRDKEYVFFGKNKIHCKSLKKGEYYSSRPFIFSALMFTYLRDEIK